MVSLQASLNSHTSLRAPMINPNLVGVARIGAINYDYWYY